VRQRSLLVSVLLVSLSASGCGRRPVPSGDEVVDPSTGPMNAQCVALCEEARPRLIASFAVPPGDIDCQDDKWSHAADCAACLDVFADDYAVSTTFQCP
jgi:hypothetical protein